MESQRQPVSWSILGIRDQRVHQLLIKHQPGRRLELGTRVEVVMEATRRHHHHPDLEVLVEEVVEVHPVEEVEAEDCPCLLQLPVQFQVPVVNRPLRVHRIYQMLLRLYSPVTLSGLMTPSTATLINLLLPGQIAHCYCYLHFAKHEQDFPMDDDKILFTLSYLWGTTQKWFEPNLYDPTPGAVPAWDGNFLLFVNELTDNFGPQDLVGDTEDAI
ncbi:hypothetical protein MVEN_00548500 [Mycena venus]|uniref:Uncharacterized protein n=1 Tax=Mycena venus TaxID=2733690 RepID=A0A8H6YPK9_9AGAR|nr:hypothetical protein MVEN_00548500 [Mycena venus]